MKALFVTTALWTTICFTHVCMAQERAEFAAALSLTRCEKAGNDFISCERIGGDSQNVSLALQPNEGGNSFGEVLRIQQIVDHRTFEVDVLVERVVNASETYYVFSPDLNLPADPARIPSMPGYLVAKDLTQMNKVFFSGESLTIGNVYYDLGIHIGPQKADFALEQTMRVRQLEVALNKK